MLCEYTKLYSPDYSKPFIIRTDSSDYAMGCTLSQLDQDDVERPIVFASAKLSEAQKKMSVIEKESFAVIFALKRLDPYIFLAKVDLYSDHDPLRFIVNNASTSPRLSRWALALTRYDLNFHHIKGEVNKVADALSRC